MQTMYRRMKYEFDIVFLFTVLLLDIISSVPFSLFPFNGFMHNLCTGTHCLTVSHKATVRSTILHHIHSVHN